MTRGGGGAKCSVVLRPTDPLDNASTGVTDLPHARNSRWLRPSRRCRVSRLRVKDHPVARGASRSRARVSVHAAVPIVVADRSTYDDGERKCAQAGEDGADRLGRSGNAGIAFDWPIRSGIYCAAVYTRRCDWKKGCRGTKSADFDGASNKLRTRVLQQIS